MPHGKATKTGSIKFDGGIDALIDAELAKLNPGTDDGGSSASFSETDVPGVVFNRSTGEYFKDGRKIPFSEYNALLDKFNAKGDTSNTVSASVAAQTGLGYSQLGESRRQFDATFQQEADKLEQQIRQWNKTYALDLQNLSLRKDELALAERNGRSQEARDIANSISNIQLRMNDNAIQLSQIKNEANALNTQMQFQAAQGNADRSMQAAQGAANRTMQLVQLTEEMRSRNLDQQIQIASELADYSRDPGDIVANIAAQQQFGSISTALGEGFDGLTEDSLSVGGRLIGVQDDAKAEGDRLKGRSEQLAGALEATLNPNFGFTRVDAPTFTPEIPNLVTPDFMGLFNDRMGATAPTAQQVAQGRLDEATAIGKDTDGWTVTEDGLFKGANPFAKFADGGFTSGPAVVGDPEKGTNKPNPEVVQWTPFGNMITPLDETGMSLDSIPDASKMADGGVQVAPELQDRARQMLLDAFLPAFEKFQRAAPDIPVTRAGVAPVSVSAPGTSTDLQEAAAGLTAAGSGVTRPQYFNDLMKSRATGITPGVIRRAR